MATAPYSVLGPQGGPVGTDPSAQNDAQLALALQGMQGSQGMGQLMRSGQETRWTNQQGYDAQMAQLDKQLATQQALAGLQSQTELQSTGMQTSAGVQEAQIAADASKYPYQLRAQQFQQLFPYYQQGFSTLNQAAQNGGMSGVANPNMSGQPKINAAPVYNQQQIQRQVNQSNAQQDAATATQQRLNSQQSAGRGFSSSSPLLSMLNQSAQMAGNATKAQNQQAIQYNAAQGNAAQLLQGQQAQEQQFSNRQQEALQRQQNLLGFQSSLFSALGNAMA